MKNEIKEILDRLETVARKHTIEVCEDGSKIETMPASVVDELRLNNFTAKVLLDYITNLQEVGINKYQTLKDLEQENEKLKREVAKLHIIQEEYGSHIENTHIIDDYQKTYFMSNKYLIELKNGKFVDINVLNDEYEDYKSRCEKAIKIICKYGRDKQLEEDYLMNRVNLANYNCLLLDILKGSDKE